MPVLVPAPSDPPELTEQLWEGFSGDLAWDVGANCGQSVALLLSRFSRIACFEPAQESFSRLQLWAGGERVSLHQIAVSDWTGTTRLAVTPGTICTGQLVSPGTHGVAAGPDWDQECAFRDVESATADDLAAALGVPQFLKVDTEGHELAVLTGARQLIAEHHPALLVEFHSPELRDGCTELLACSGYRVQTIRHPHYPPGSLPWQQHGWLRALPGSD